MSKGKLKVTVEQVPVSGETSTKEYEVAATVKATSVGDLARELGISIKNRNVFVNGSPATQDTLVPDGATMTLRVAERPRGS